MTQYIVVDGDTIPSKLEVSDAQVMVDGSPALKGTGHATIGGKAVCLANAVKEQKFSCKYQTIEHTIPGTGTLTIRAVAAPHVSSEEAVMVSEGDVEVDFELGKPATTPPPEAVPDGTKKRSAIKKLIMANDFVTAPSE